MSKEIFKQVQQLYNDVRQTPVENLLQGSRTFILIVSPGSLAGLATEKLFHQDMLTVNEQIAGYLAVASFMTLGHLADFSSKRIKEIKPGIGRKRIIQEALGLGFLLALNPALAMGRGVSGFSIAARNMFSRKKQLTV